MKKLLVILPLLLTMGGCASLKLNPYQDLSNEAIMWQAAHLVDVGQTLEIAKHPECFHESDPLTRRLIGKNPSKEKVIAWGIASSYAVAQLDHVIQDSDLPDWGKKTIGYLNLGFKLDVVNKNYGIGIRIGAKPKPLNNCYKG